MRARCVHMTEVLPVCRAGIVGFEPRVAGNDLARERSPDRKEHVVNDDQLKGKLEQGEGKAQEKWGDAKEKVDDLRDDLEDKTSRDPSDETEERPAEK
jgi:hypothetical protein